MDIKNEKVEYEDRVVAFVDILGFKAFVRETLSDANKVALLWQATERTSLLVHKLDEVVLGRPGALEIIPFSDSIVISDLADDRGLSQVMGGAMEIYNRLQYMGLLCRGALARGPLYHRGGTVFGPALVAAYELEQSASKLPIISLSSKVVSLVAEVCRTTSSYTSLLEDMTIQQLDTGLVLLDPYVMFRKKFIFDKAEFPFTIQEFCRTVKRFFSFNLAQHLGAPELYTKYFWAAEELNKLIRIAAPDVGVIDASEIHPGIKFRTM